jgi:hypothetical protein
MLNSRLAVVALLVGAVAGAAASSTAQTERASVQGPPVPFEDAGACPGEGCVYREWTAKAVVNVRTERRPNARIGFTLRGNEKVTAITGVVVTLKAGRVEFREPKDVSSASGPVHFEPGDTLYLLTYEGEGFTKAWFKGKLYVSLDAADFYNGVCDFRPSRCIGKIVEKSRTEWWVQIRNRLGAVGWTNEPEKFNGKDALGGS